MLFAELIGAFENNGDQVHVKHKRSDSDLIENDSALKIISDFYSFLTIK